MLPTAGLTQDCLEVLGGGARGGACEVLVAAGLCVGLLEPFLPVGGSVGEW